ncbi:MAG: AAA family ATPase [Myxococcota bacterium]
MATTIEFAENETAQLLGGQPGTGKTTLLRALGPRLEQNPEYKVVVCDLQGYCPKTEPIEAVDFWRAAAHSLYEAMAAADLLAYSPGREGSWSRLDHFGEEATVGTETNSSETGASLPLPPHKNTGSSIESVRIDFHDFVQDCIASMQQKHGAPTQLIVAFDGLDTLASIDESAAASIELLFIERRHILEIPSLHTVYAIPYWLHWNLAARAAFDGHHIVPCVKVRTPGAPGNTSPSLDPRGIALLRRLVEARTDDGDWLAWFLGDAATFDEIALASGGNIRILLRLLRDMLVEADGVPVSEHHRRRTIARSSNEYTRLMTNQDAAWLSRVEESGFFDADDSIEHHRLETLLDMNILLAYRNGKDWYGLLPAIREDILRRAQAWHEARSDVGEHPAIPGDSTATSAATVVHAAIPAVRVVQVELEYIRCFDDISLDLARGNDSTDWTLLLGDNAHGKSTMLRCIALGLCAESEAAALLEATPGPLLRHGESEGTITLTLVDAEGRRHSSVTKITSDHEGEPGAERVRRVKWKLSPDQVFVCGYGANRTRTADLSHSGYSRHDAVRSLFDDDTSLQNPELILRRQQRMSRERIERKLLEILMLDRERARISYSSTHGLKILGPWASGDWVDASLPTLSDGYRSTTQWVVDLIGWLVYAGRFVRDEDMTGIVLVDELEQHLHPRWQRYIIALLRKQFPGLQFIASTHTPLLALGLADHEHGLLVQLSKNDEQQVKARYVQPHEFRGLRADQILTAPRGFGLPTTRSPKSADRIARYSELASKSRSEEEEREFVELRALLDKTLVLGETPYERRVETAVREALAKLAAEPRAPLDEVQEYELRRQLAELFDEGDPT